MEPTRKERAEYEQLRQQIEAGFARITFRLDHILGRHDAVALAGCPSCEARQHPEA
ncbi:hypothetical protein ACFW5I_10485 [Streptomyces sp. NPDC058818]|uniref:hypothetical protein n=1 Tax=Streptomyces sp. NPDC058818 TaxID=3346640 RepID=UPI00368E9EBF